MGQTGGMGTQAGTAQGHADGCLPQQLAVFCPPLPAGFCRLYRDQTRCAAESGAPGRHHPYHAGARRPYRGARAPRAGTRRGLCGAQRGRVDCDARRVGRRASEHRRLHRAVRCQCCGADSGGGGAMIEPLVFLWPAFLVAVCLVGIHVYFGIQVLARQVIFVDLALAQIAALGATVAFMLGHSAQSPATYGYSLSFTLLAAVLLAFTRAWGTRVPQEALIGVIYVVAAAAAILLIDRAPQGAEHLKQILTGNILTSGLNDAAVIVPLYLAIGLLHWLLRDRLTGAGSFAWDFVFYASFGIVVTSSVALAGVLLVFSFLIIPASIGVLYARTPGRQLVIGWIAGTITSAAGLALSFAFDLPTGATMVCTFGGVLALGGLIYPLLFGDARLATRRSVVALRWCVALVIAGSAVL